MRKNKKKQKGRGMRVLLFMALLAFFLTGLAGNSLSVKAINQLEDAVGLLAGYADGGEDPVFLSSVIEMAVGDGRILITSTYGGGADYIRVATNNTSVDLQMAEVAYENIDGLGLAYWEVQDVPEDDFVTCACPVQNSRATLVYLSTAENLQIKTAEIVFQEMKDGIFTVEGLPKEEGMIYPAPAVDSSGNLVAVAASGSVFYCPLDINEADFYGNSGESGSGGTDSGNGGNGGTDSGNSGNGGTDSGNGGSNSGKGNYGGGSGSGGTGTNSESGMGKEIIGVLIIGGCAGAIGLFIRKKKSSGSKKNPPSQEGWNQAPPPQPMQPQEPASFGDYEDSGPYYEQPTEALPPAPAPVRQETTLWLAARGGYMDGRVYPIEPGGITIGRDVSNTIRYPREEAGVSRSHAKLYWENGRLKLMDCNSSYGVFLKGSGKIQPMYPVEVKVGDIFYIAEKKNMFEIKR